MKNTVHMNFQALLHANFQFDILSVVQQYWVKDRGWSEFKNTPRYSSNLLMVVTDTNVRYTSDTGAVLEAGYGDVIYVPYGAVYNFELIGGPDADNDKIYKTICINFNMIVRNSNEIITLSNRPIKVMNTHDPHLEHLFREIAQIRTQSPLTEQCCLYNIMLSLTKTKINFTKGYSIIKPALNLLETNFSNNIRISTLSDACHLSECHFRKLFREYTGLSPIEYRNQLRIRKAKELLADGNLSIAEIASAVGIEDQFYFSRIFKAAEGVSPLEYKKL